MRLFVFTPAGFERLLVELSALSKETLVMESVNQMVAAHRTS
jgi:hypothetical protein